MFKKYYMVQFFRGDTPFREQHEHWMTDAPPVEKLLKSVYEGVLCLSLILEMLLRV